MIKLKSLYNEIKITKGPSAKEVYYLFIDITMAEQPLADKEKWKIIRNYFKELPKVLNGGKEFEELNQNDLNKLYFELNNIKKKYLIKEIKLSGNITPEKVGNIIDELIFVNDNGAAVEILDTYGFYGRGENSDDGDYIINNIYNKKNIIDFLNGLPKNKLNRLYIDLINLKKQ